MSKIIIKYSKDFVPSSGVKTSITWSKLKPELQKIFNCLPNEEIVGLEVDERGITGTFELK